MSPGRDGLLDELRPVAFGIAYRMLGSVAEAEDVVLYGDGGGKVPALARSVHGRSRVARTLVAWTRAGRRIVGASLEPVVVNGQPGALLRDGRGGVISVLALDILDGQIQAIRSIVNPDKLAHLGPPGEYPGRKRPEQ